MDNERDRVLRLADNAIASSYDATASAHWSLAMLWVGLFATDPARFAVGSLLALLFVGSGVFVRWVGPGWALRVTTARDSTQFEYRVLAAIDRKLRWMDTVGLLATGIANVASVLAGVLATVLTMNPLPAVLAGAIGAYQIWVLARRAQPRRA